MYVHSTEIFVTSKILKKHWFQINEHMFMLFRHVTLYSEILGYINYLGQIECNNSQYKKHVGIKTWQWLIVRLICECAFIFVSFMIIRIHCICIGCGEVWLWWKDNNYKNRNIVYAILVHSSLVIQLCIHFHIVCRADCMYLLYVHLDYMECVSKYLP